LNKKLLLIRTSKKRKF